MKSAGELFEDAMIHWRDNKGIGTALIPPPLNDKVMVLGTLQRIYARSPTANVVVIVNNFQERADIIEFITQQEGEEENNTEFKKLIESGTLKIFTINLIINGYDKSPFVSIMYHLDTMCDKVIAFLSRSKFKLIILSKLMNSVEDMNKLYQICPLLPDFKQNEIDEIRVNTPVEETWVKVVIPENDDDKKLLDYYNEYVTTSLNIFGSFELIKEARLGNEALNISAAQICQKIAYDNGWNEHLDMNVEYNIQIDALYNPSNIRDRATQTYEIIRNRAQLLSDYIGKLEEIAKIVKEHKDEKILIINKRGEFANKVTEYLNDNSETIICGNYHDKVDNIPAVDLDGNPLFYKSGPHKGERRYMAAKAQKTMNEQLFNIGKLQVLSTNSAPDKDLSANVDIVIITSPQCEDIKSYMYRLSNVYYPSGTIKLYSLFIKDSLEEQRLNSKPLSELHRIVNKCENSVIVENNSDFVIVD